MYRVVSAIALLVMCEAMRDQSIAVKGRFLCGTAPAANVRVKLIDIDTGPDPDDLLSQGYTDAKGDFMLSGGTAETTQIDPVLKVYHDCNDVTQVGGVPKPGSRKVTFVLPSKYITNGKIPKTTMDIGIINLELEFQNEGRELIVS
ncbi:Transthyretin-like family protein [Ancylostoma duodenale]|uniref:Transthyretin-like family protein n=1 Tax=Ancylostoma duodenale TaxID=51022 RepID=A0A0C2FI89_9BILA|nr:Transthyretin-like family protein [Ancylostoma duodenale]